MGPSAKLQLISLFLVLVFTIRVSCSFPNKVDVRNPRFNRTTGRFMKLGGNTVQTIRASKGSNHLVGITNGKSTGIGGVLGAKETKVFGDSLRQGLRKVLPLRSTAKHNRVSSTGKNSNFNSRQTQINQHGSSMRKSTPTGRIANVLKVGSNVVNKLGNIQMDVSGRSTSGNRGRSNNVVSKNGGGSANTPSRSANRGQHLSRGSNSNVHSKTPSNGKTTVRVSQAGNVRHNTKNVNQNIRQHRSQSLSTRRGSGNTRSASSSTSTKGRVGSVRSSNARAVSSAGSTNGRISGVSTSKNQNGVNWNKNSANKRGGMVRNTANVKRNIGQSARQSQRLSNQQSGRINTGQNRMTRISQRRGGHHPFQVSSGMQSNIRRRIGGIPRGISNHGKRVVVQNGRRIIVSPSRYSLNQQRQNSYQQQAPRQVRIMGDPVEGGLENMDIDNIIGLASKLAQVKLANSVLSSFNEQEGTPQLSRFLIDSELDIVPELIVPVPRQPEQASTRRIITITQPASAAKQLESPPVAKNQVTVSSSGYGTPVLVRSNGDIQFSRVDQTGKEISSVTISKGKSKPTKKGNKSKAGNAKSKPKHNKGTEGAAAGGTSQQTPEKELEMEMETEGLSTTTIAATTKTKKPLLPPTTTVANSVIVL